MVINLALVAILLLVGGGAFRGGLWQGLILFLNVVVAATIAVTWYESLAGLLEKYLAAFTYFLDVVSLWLLFVLILVVLGTATHQVAKASLKFIPPVEWAGSILVALMTAWTVVELAAFTIHIAPLSTSAVPMPPEQSMLYGMKPDAWWLWWARGSTRNGPFAVPAHRFDAQDDFFARHAKRREQLASEPSIVLPVD
jgi:hypothetical protein